MRKPRAEGSAHAWYTTGVQRPRNRPWPCLCALRFVAERDILDVGLPGLEPGTSSLSEKRDVLQELSRVCKFPANSRILTMRLFLSFQDIRLGCCTVAAHLTHFPSPGMVRCQCRNSHLHPYTGLLIGTQPMSFERPTRRPLMSDFEGGAYPLGISKALIVTGVAGERRWPFLS